MRLSPLPEFSRPLLFAHRGVSAEAPENTMAAFKLARTLGVPGVELDFHRCGSGELVVIHDEWTGRVGNSNLLVTSESYAALSEVDVGSKKAPEFSSERIPLLGDVLEEFGKELYFDIEIKASTAADRGAERALADLITGTRSNHRVVVSSFNPIALRRFKRFLPDVPTAIIYSADREVPWFLRHGEGRWIGAVDFLKPSYRKITALGRFLNHTLGRRSIVPWTIDDPEIAQRCLAAGCDGIISNRPHKLGLL